MKRLIAIAGLLLFSLVAVCQSTTGVLLGTVSDATGVIPGAEVTAVNQNTGISTTVKSNGAGGYAVTNLIPGTYTLTIKAEGYKTVEIKNNLLVINQQLRNNVLLASGGVTEVVEVQPDAGTTTSDSPSIATVTTSKELLALPANGRTISAVIATVPGNSGDGSDSNPKISGSQHWGGTSFQVNGVNYDDRGNGGGSYGLTTSLTTQPSLDTIQDVKIETNAAKAEFASSVAVVMTTKGGTNRFHGTAHEYNRNRDASANEYFAKQSGTARLPFNRNEFGGTIGGPLWKDHTFFFFSFERYSLRQSRQGYFIVPTDAQRTGQFTTRIRIPGTTTYYTGNKIPDAQLNQVFQKVLAYVPHANTTYGSYNLTQPRQTNMDLNRWSGKLEHQFNARNRLAFDANWAETGLYFSNQGYPMQYGNYSDAGFLTRSGALTYTRILSSNMTNELRASYYVMRSTRVGQNTDFDGSTLVPGLYPHAIGGIPIFSMTSYTRIGDVGGSRNNPQMTQQYGDTFTWKKGSHTVKAGFDFQLTKVSTNPGSSTSTLGYFNFLSSRYTLNGLANALLGIPTSALRAEVYPPNVITQNRYGMYLQDDWQLAHRLSLYYGLRYELQTVPTERQGQWTNFDYASGNLVVRSVGGRIPSTANATYMSAYPIKLSEDVGWGSNVLVADKVNLAPRVGFAFRPLQSGDTVIRGGFGLFWNMPPIYQGVYQLGISNPPYRLQQIFTGGATTPTISLSDPFASASTVTTNPIIYSMDRNIHNTYTEQWNLSLEQKLPQNIGLRLSYVGNKAVHTLFVNYEMNHPKTMVAISGTDSSQNYLPYQPYANIYGMRFIGSGITHQMQLVGTKRFQGSLFFQGNLSWTKSLDNNPDTGSPQDSYNAAGDRGNADGVRRITFYLTGSYELPFGKGKRWLNSGNGIVERAAGGWKVTTVTRLMSGSPFSASYTTNPANSYATRADRVVGVDPYAVTNRTLKTWLNVSAFAAPNPTSPTAGTIMKYGNSQRNMLFGPGYKMVNLSLQKTTRLLHGTSLLLQADAFNLTNSANFYNPASDVSVPSTFGIISSTIADPRQLQFGAKFQF